MINTIVIEGNTTSEGRIFRKDQNSSVYVNSIAVKDSYKENADVHFFNIKAFNSLAEHCYERISQGSSVTIQGRLATKTSTLNGTTVTDTVIIISSISIHTRFKNLSTDKPNPNVQNQGYNQNMQQNYNPNVQNQGYNQNMQQNYNPNIQQGYNQNMQQNYNPNIQQGYNSNMQQNYNPNIQQGYNQNMQQGYNPNIQNQGYNQNMQQGYNPNVQNQGYNQNMQSGYNTNQVNNQDINNDGLEVVETKKNPFDELD